MYHSRELNGTSSRSSYTSSRGSSRLCGSIGRIKLLEWFFTSFCLLGGIYQISNICDVYFLYGTSSTVEIRIPKNYPTDSLTLCVRFTDILDYKRINQDNPSRDWNYTITDAGIRKYQNELSISEIFTYTPNLTRVIERSTFRRPRSYAFFECNRLQCLDFFNISRFVYLEFICYTMHPLFLNETLSYEALTITPSAPGKIFNIFLTPEFDRSFVIKVCSHEPNSLPYTSLPYVPFKRREYDIHTNTAKFNSFVASTTKLTVLKLPPPHDTMCKNYTKNKSSSRSQSIQDCMREKVYLSLNKIPFSVIVDEPQNLHMVSYLDTENSTISEMLFQFENECMNINKRDDCLSEISLTDTRSVTYDKFKLSLYTAYSPSTEIRTIRQTDFVEFLTVVMSTVSTWSGLEIISLNPVFLFLYFHGRVRMLKRLFKGHSSRKTFPKAQVIALRTTVARPQVPLPERANANDSPIESLFIKYLTRQRQLTHALVNVEHRLKNLESLTVQRGRKY